MPDELLTIAQAAAMMGVTADCAYRLCRTNRLAHYRVGARGGAIRLRPVDVRRYLRACRVESSLPRGQGAGRVLKHITV